MNDYKSLRKKSGSRTLAIVMVLLLVLEMCSMAVLFSQLASYSAGGRNYVISLTEGADRTKSGTVDTSKTGFIVPTSVVDPDTLIEPIDKVNVYDFGFSTYDQEQVWTTDTDVALFHLSYDNETGQTTVLSEDTNNVFAPGTANTYGFTVANTGSHDLAYLVYIEAVEDTDGNKLPLVGRLRKGDGTYIVGSEGDSSTWPDVLELHESGDLSALQSGKKMDYFIDWEWPFERFDGEGLEANDAYDTMLGNLAVDTDLWLRIKIKTVAWWEDYWFAFADVKTGDDTGTATVTPDYVDQASDDTFTFVATPAEGYEFVGWEFDEDDIFDIVDGDLNSPVIIVRPGSDVHGHAIFKPIETEPGVEYWHATADVIEGEGTAVVDPPMVVRDSGDTFEFVATPEEGWEFDHWEFDDDDVFDIVDGSLTDPRIVVDPHSDVHGHAVFKKSTEPTEPPTTPPTEPPTTPPTEPPTTPPTEPPTTPPTEPPTTPPTEPPTTPPTEPPTEVKYWTAVADVIEGEGTATVTPHEVVQGSDDTFTFIATPEDGWEFDHWEFDDGDIYTVVDGGLDSPVIVVVPGSDVHGHAVFKPVATEPHVDYWHAVADVIEGEGSATVDPTVVEQGSDDTFTFIAVPDDGWEFVGWEFDEGDVYEVVEGSLDSPVIVVRPGSDVHGHAIFRRKATEAPTEKPTAAPTVAPTSAPTQAPTTPSGQPKTNDVTNTIFWLILSIVVLIALIVVFLIYRRIRKAEKAGQRVEK